MMNGASKSPPATDKKALDGRRSTRGGTTKGSVARSESPTKKAARKIATPRKTARKGRSAASVEPEFANGGSEDTHEEMVKHEENVKVQIESEKHPSADGGQDIEHTKVNIEMPSTHPDLEIPDDAESMLEKAREMVNVANEVGGARTTTPRTKRKAAELDSDGEVAVGPLAKRAKKVELELRKEKIKRRAVTGIVASLAIGYVLLSPHHPRLRC